MQKMEEVQQQLIESHESEKNNTAEKIKEHEETMQKLNVRLASIEENRALTNQDLAVQHTDHSHSSQQQAMESKSGNSSPYNGWVRYPDSSDSESTSNNRSIGKASMVESAIIGEAEP